MKLEDIPQTGILILSTYFDGYKDTYANDSRRKIKKQASKLAEKEDITLIPLQFSLIWTITEGVNRAIGVQRHYGFSGMTPESFEKIYNEIEKKKYKWWKKFDIIIGKHEYIPQTGILILSAYFKEHGNKHINDARRDMRKEIVKIEKKEYINVKLIPLQFSLIRSIVDGVSRAIGAQCHYGFSGMTPESFEKIYNEIEKKKFKWIKNFEIIIANTIEGFE
jgi:hypothetical protein